MANPQRPHRNDLGSLFAASLVTVLGTGICCTLFLVGSESSAFWPVLLIIAPAVIFLAALVGVRFPGFGAGLEFWHSVFRARARDDRDMEYQPRRMEPERMRPAGDQRPITAKEVREIRLTNGNTWVPARGRKKRRDDEYLD